MGNGTIIPAKKDIRYLDTQLNCKLTRKKHSVQMETVRYHNEEALVTWAKIKIKLDTKLLLYKTMLMPVWTCGIHFWGYGKSSNIKNLILFQIKSLRMITDAAWMSTIEKFIPI